MPHTQRCQSARALVRQEQGVRSTDRDGWESGVIGRTVFHIKYRAPDHHVETRYHPSTDTPYAEAEATDKTALLMHDDQNRPPWSGPFGMGWQGYLIVAIVILGSAVFAATRSDWVSLLVSALGLPLLIFSLLFLLTRLLSRSQQGAPARDRRIEPRQGMDLLTFLARTNPFMFLLFGALTRRQDDPEYQQLLRSGPFTLGRQGYTFLFLMLVVFGLAPLIVTLIFVAVMGHPPTHTDPHFP
jgi:hypothetical protein